jgi:hypothetical protein
MFDLDSAETVKSFLVGSFQEFQRIPVTKWGLDTELAGEVCGFLSGLTLSGGGKGAARSTILGWDKGGGTGQKGCNYGELHGIKEFTEITIGRVCEEICSYGNEEATLWKLKRRKIARLKDTSLGMRHL